VPGRRIIQVSWAGNAVFAVTAIPVALGVDSLEAVAIVVALALFAISLGVWVWAFAVAVTRSTQGDDIVVGNLFLLEGDVPKPVRLQLFLSLAVCIVITAATASADPFGVLVPMLPIGLIGLWGARHGTYRLRPEAQVEVRPLRPQRKRSGGRSEHAVRSPKRPDE
jgi:hypothetical protein